MGFAELFKKTAFVSIFTSLIILGTNFFLSLIMMKSDYGLYSYYYSIWMILLSVIPYGTTMAVVVFMHKETANDFISIVNNGVYRLIPLVFLFSSLLLFSFHTTLFHHQKNITLFSILILTLGGSLILVTITYYRARQDMLKYAKLFLGYTIFSSICTIVSYIITRSINQTFFILSITTLILSFSYIYQLKKDMKVSLFHSNSRFNLSWSLKYGSPVVLSSATMSFALLGDKIILGSFVDGASLAAYSVAALLSSTILFIVNNFASAWGGFLAKNIPSISNESAYSDYSKQIKKRLILIFFSIVGIISFQLIVYYLIYIRSYPDMQYVIINLTFAYAVLGLSKYYIGYMNYFQKNQAVFFSSLFGVCVAFLSFYFLFEEYGYKIMSLSILLGMISQLFFCLKFTNRLMKKYRIRNDI